MTVVVQHGYMAVGIPREMFRAFGLGDLHRNVLVLEPEFLERPK
jgi:hypothetical protein